MRVKTCVCTINEGVFILPDLGACMWGRCCSTCRNSCSTCGGSSCRRASPTLQSRCQSTCGDTISWYLGRRRTWECQAALRLPSKVFLPVFSHPPVIYRSVRYVPSGHLRQHVPPVLRYRVRTGGAILQNHSLRTLLFTRFIFGLCSVGCC